MVHTPANRIPGETAQLSFPSEEEVSAAGTMVAAASFVSRANTHRWMPMGVHGAVVLDDIPP